MNATKRKTPLPGRLAAVRLLLLLVVALCGLETRVWSFAATPPAASGEIAFATSSFIGENYDAVAYDASDSLVAARTATPSGQFHSVAFETRLSPSSYPGVLRPAHFQEANEALLRAMESDAQFAQMMQQGGINLQRTATGLAPRTSPAGWTWHHAQEPGVMQLVPRSQHAPGSIFQNTLHPGGQGGYSIWGQ